jgi:hypothetical protein
VNEPGKVAYAKRSASIYTRLQKDAEAAYARVGLEELRCREGTNDTLAHRVDARRKKEQELVSTSPFCANGTEDSCSSTLYLAQNSV